jgi:excisionase family DNA binding protein
MLEKSAYERGWDRAFGKLAADLAVERAAGLRLEAAAERGARVATPELLTYGEAADRLKVTNRTVRNLIERGELTRVTIPATNAHRVAAAEVAELVERGRAS